jgi:hypothetical protein
VARHTSEGLSRREIIRCLQRYVARELYQVLASLAPSSSSWPPQRLERVGHPETPKARAAGLTHPLQSLTIRARRGHHPEPLDRQI